MSKSYPVNTKYEQYPSANVLSKRINGRGTHNFRTLKPTIQKYPPPYGEKK